MTQISQVSQLSQRDKVLNIMIASDNHLGFKEDKSTERFQDSFLAFEEVLKKAVEHKVDLLLLGGDLFHEKQPTQQTLFKAVELFQKYVFGDFFGGISLEKSTYVPNFCNCNFNIGLPIFAINGNHDDHTSEEESISVLDILHQSKLVTEINYFGKITNNSYIKIKPIVIVKNNIRVALYGVGYIADYQFNKLIDENKFILEDINTQQFNILVIHQNRYKGTGFAEEKNFMEPRFFRKYPVNLIVWGHEHEAKDVLEQTENNIYVFQPGSTVITSLIEAESTVKQMGLISLAYNKSAIEFQSIKLVDSFRPLLLEDVELQLVVNRQKNKNKPAQDIAEECLVKLMDETIASYYRDSPYKHKKPLIRFKVEHSGFELNRLKWLQNKYQDQVANPNKIFLFWKRKAPTQRQSEAQKQQIQQMDSLFNQKLKNKEIFGQDSELQLSSLQVLPSKFLKYSNYEELSKENIDKIYQKSVEVMNRSFMDKKANQLNALVRREQEEYNEMLKEYKSQNLQGKQEEMPRREISYVGHVSNFIDSFKLELKSQFREVAQQSQEIEEEVQEERKKSEKKKKQSEVKVEQQSEEDDYFAFMIENKEMENSTHNESDESIMVMERQEKKRQKKEGKQNQKRKKDNQKAKPEKKRNSAGFF